MTQKAMICPRCRRLIGSTESSCSWCGARRPGSWWQATAWTRNALEGDWLVRAIITANVVFFIFSLIIGAGGGSGNPLSLFSPSQTSLLLLGATGTIPIDMYHRTWTLLSANYLHGGILHIVFNMMALRQIAPWVVREYGPSRMFVIYTLGGVFGFWLSYVAGVPLTIGASASICGLIGSLLYYGKSRGGAYGSAVYREVSGWVIGLGLIGLLMPGINNWAHAGGIVGGVVLGMLLKYEERRPETAVHRGLALLCAAATVGVLGWAVLGAVALRLG
ncbi:MAG TPA: rhomboid family intramembrane serine protease [Geobacteraceae bacterium]|nr:rhomboid family intramembrane serine protease [Geobacteraceae bacterium]